ncbi:hypothetical protein DCAR_0831406 [Daucus carota subsp. sativus]|uniref:Uncharacterized protein n=1 Tax=Daucus carota subsp. sativus TaxID=79200 RepID=A0AAF0XPJ2_DAUCS|nr:hypothetical protein DCAR_0831406 [Daucus carota subsp. sativus]
MNRNIITMPANESIDVCFLCFTLFSWANCFLLCCSRLQINLVYIRYRSIGLLALTLGWVQLHTPLRTRLQAVNNQGLCLDRMKIWILIYDLHVDWILFESRILFDSFEVVKKEDKNARRTVLNSVVRAMYLSIQQF